MMECVLSEILLLLPLQMVFAICIESYSTCISWVRPINGYTSEKESSQKIKHKEALRMHK